MAPEENKKLTQEPHSFRNKSTVHLILKSAFIILFFL